MPPRSRGPACPGARAIAAAAPWRSLPDRTRASALTRPCLPRLISLLPPPSPFSTIHASMLHMLIHL